MLETRLPIPAAVAARPLIERLAGKKARSGDPVRQAVLPPAELHTQPRGPPDRERGGGEGAAAVADGPRAQIHN